MTAVAIEQCADINSVWRRAGPERFPGLVREMMASARAPARPVETRPLEFWQPRLIGRLFAEIAWRPGSGPRAPLVEDSGSDGRPAGCWEQGWRLVFHRSAWRFFNGRFYRSIRPETLEGYVARFIESRAWLQKSRQGVEEERWQSATPATVRSVLMGLRGQAVVSDDVDPPVWLSTGESATETLVLANGLLDLDVFFVAVDKGEGEGFRLGEHDPDLLAVNGLPFEFRPDATCDRWERFLVEVLPDEGCRRVLQEWAGYCLIPSQEFQRMLVLVGEGANGKSVVMDVMRDLVGPENCSGAQLDHLHEPHALQALDGKLLNLATEWTHLERSAVTVLKAISGGDSVTINPKHRAAYEATLPTRFMTATNELPRIQDRSSAIWRRLMVMPFPVTIAPGARRPKGALLREFREELSGILLWALRGLWRLRRRGDFELPAVMVGAGAEIRAESNPAGSWCEEMLEARAGAETLLQDVYSSYRTWCEAGGMRALTLAHFSREVRRWFKRATGGEVEIVRQRRSGQQARVMRGIGRAGEEDQW